MDAMPEQWTESRLDELSHRVDQGFIDLRGDLRVVRVETRTEFTALRGELSSLEAKIDKKIDRLDAKIDAKVDGLDAKIDSKIDGLDKKIDRLSMGMLFAAIGVIGALVGSGTGLI